MAARAMPGKPLGSMSPAIVAYSAACLAPRTPCANEATRSATARDGFGGRPALGIEAALQGIDQRRAHHRAIGAAGNRPGLIRRSNPESDADRQMRVALDAADRRCHLFRIGRCAAGDAGDRHVIDKARGIREHRRQPLVVGGRRRQANEIEARLQRGNAEFVVLFRRHIDKDQPIDAGGLGIGQKPVDAVDVDRIVVAHQDDRRGVIAAAEVAHQRDRLLQRRAGLQGAQAARLNRRTIRHRIGEGHADLDDIRARLRQRLDDVERGFEVGIAGHQEGDERRAAFALQFGKTGIDAGGHAAAAAVLHLSPPGRGRPRSGRVRGSHGYSLAFVALPVRGVEG